MPTLRLTDKQASTLDWMLAINAQRDVEREINAWASLEESGLGIHDTDEQRAEFRDRARSNREFYAEKLVELYDLRDLLNAARGLSPVTRKEVPG